MEMKIRHANEGDLPALVRLYNHYIESSPATFDLAPHTVEERREWFAKYAPAGRYRMLVADAGEAAEGVSRILGFAGSGPFRPKAAYGPSVEASIYVAAGATGRGVGVALYDELLPMLRAEPSVHRVLAGITLPNAASEGLHRRFGFEPVGVFREVGFKFDRYWDVGWYQLDVA